MILSANRRAGISLMEALVAIFVTAIGLLALLTLFPLGALQMGRALKDDRCAQCAWQADGTVRVWWQSEATDLPTNESNFWKDLDNAATAPPTSTGPSVVVAIDPIGMNSGRNGQNLAGSAIVRRQPNATTNPDGLVKSMRACSLLDDIFFNAASTPDITSGNTGSNPVARQGRYNWMALVQRPVNTERYSANLKILVFDGRAPGTAPTHGEQLLTAAATANAGDRRIQFNAQNPFPAGPTDTNFLLAKGGWLMDAGTTAAPRMDFYRIASVTASGTSAFVDFDPPLRNSVTQMVFLAGLAEVFDRPMLSPSVTIADPVP